MHIKHIALALAITLISACATTGNYIDASVSSFHKLQMAEPAGMVVAIYPWRPELADSLEFSTYAESVAGELRAQGISVADAATPPTHALFLDYGIDDGRFVTSTYSVPQWGVTGYSGSTTTGTVTTIGNTSRLNAQTTLNKTYGVTGYTTGVNTRQVFSRVVNIDIVRIDREGDNHQKLYEARLRSQGSCGNLPSVMPQLIKGILSDFPGQSGKSRNITLPWDGSC